jgi:hypothetical protein
MDRSKQLAFPIHPTNTSSVCIELVIRICCIGRKLKRCRYGLELHVAMPAFVRTLTEPSIFASARIEWLSCGSRISALGSSPRPAASRSRRKRPWINDDATIARPEILLAAVGNPALSHSTTYPRSASLTSRRGSRPIPRFLTRNRKFESISLQGGVCEPSVPQRRPRTVLRRLPPVHLIGPLSRLCRFRRVTGQSSRARRAITVAGGPRVESVSCIGEANCGPDFRGPISQPNAVAE